VIDNEATMAREAARIGAWLLVPVVGVAGLVRGPAGALTALGALVMVVGSFWVTGHSLARAGRVSPLALQATALGGFFLRLVLYAGLIVVLRPIEAVDGPVLAIATAVSLVVLLSAEVRMVTRNGELWWLTLPSDETKLSSGSTAVAVAPSLSAKERA